ncbi:toxin-antitoxin system toxin component Fic family [Clostridium sp. CAG:433]|nr:toxin-antitoxin system toxin component Fic family [Clostridium sp. CAG:433]
MTLKEEFIKLGYTEEDYEIIRNNYAVNQIKDETLIKKLKDNFAFLLKMGYTKEEVIKMTKSSPQIYSYSIENMKQKIEDIISGQIYDAYSLLIDIFNEAKKEIIIIDNYADKSILDMITNLNVKVIIVTKKFNLLKDIDIKKYNKQYHNLKVIYSDKFHDRFIILDKKVLYHSGASYKDLGNKCFAINKIEDNEYLKNILKKIKE